MRGGRIAAIWRVLVAMGIAVGVNAETSASAADVQSDRIERGREIFTMNFARPDSQLDDGQLGLRGNGLGPLLNDTSCVNCHHQGGVGGAGGLDSNVLMVGIVTRPRPTASLDVLIRDARTLHPGFSEDSPVQVLHRFALSDAEKTSGYDSWRDRVLTGFGASPEQPTVVPLRRQVGSAELELVQRNTPALFGIGLIDRLRESGGDAIRQKLAMEQARRLTSVTGRLPRTSDQRPGWFGARGQVGSLEEFVKSACANEMGLQVAGFPEVELQPLESAQSTKKKPKPRPRADLTTKEVTSLVSYVASLPKPVQATGDTPEQSRRLADGRAAFSEFGCAECHVPDLGSVRGLYSDMLLHDMGEEMTDVQTAVPELKVNRTVMRVATGGGGGYGSTVSLRTLVNVSVEEIPSNPEQEWKTPPLWGVRDSYPYWHDGRALTLDAAILLHAGEAAPSRAAYEQAPPSRQQALVSFLESLEAPQTADPVER
jgi:CxxC motif-containing protein (DUF1111 family)